MISNWWTEAAPWRCTVPRQSAPVSPPPMITTRLPAARDRGRRCRVGGVDRPVGQRQELHGLVDAGQLPAGIGRSRATVAPTASTTASWAARISAAALSPAHRHPAHELGALGAHLLQPAVEEPLLHLELGDPVAEQAAGLVVALVDGDGVAGPGELLGGGQAGGPRTDHRHPPARSAPTAGRASPIPRPRPGR